MKQKHGLIKIAITTLMTSIMILSCLLAIALCSCEEKTGYYNPDQQDRIKALTSVKWIQHNDWISVDGSPVDTYETWNFDSTGKGSWNIRNEQDGKVTEENTYYFQWTFTNDTFAVIYMIMQKLGDSYWLIDKLDSKELRVYQASQDPVLYPGTEKTYQIYTPVKK